MRQSKMAWKMNDPRHSRSLAIAVEKVSRILLTASASPSTTDDDYCPLIHYQKRLF